MRPYYAIVKDSFRAAMASRVLYVLLFLITVLLLALAPFHLRETLDWKLQLNSNVLQPEQLLARIVERRGDEKPVGRIWEMLPSDLREEMIEFAGQPDDDTEGEDASDVSDGEDGLDRETGATDASAPDSSSEKRRRGEQPEFVAQIHAHERLVKELNVIIENRDFFRPEDWSDRRMPSEAESLVERGVESLSDIRVKRLNRLLMGAAVSPTIVTGNATALDFYFATWKTPITLSITQQQFAQVLTSQLPVYFDKFVMSIGLMIAILVTANMVPETFEPGSLNLLLSKPISRWGLYVSKFVGGCVFIGLCAGYLFLGVWLWMGLAMEVWDRAMLLSIPLYIIVFAIYFSVSAFVGLIWRSAIVAVILTLLFWGCCFTVGSIYGSIKTKMDNGEFIALLPVEGEVVASDVIHQVATWDPAENAWKQQLAAKLGEEGTMAINISSYFAPLRQEASIPGLSDFIAPVYDSASHRILAGRFEFGSFMNRRGKKLFAADTSDYQFKEVGRFPRDTLRLFETPGGMVAVTSRGAFYRLDRKRFDAAFAATSTLAEQEDQSSGEGAEEGSSGEGKTGDLSESRSQADAKKTSTASLSKNLFKKIGPQKRATVRAGYHIGYSRERDEFAFYRNGTLKIFRANPKKGQSEEGQSASEYSFHASLELDLAFDKSMSVRVAFGGQTLFLAFGNGEIITVNAQTLTEENEFQPESRSAIRQVAGSPDGQYFAALYRNGNLWLLDTQKDQQENQQMRLANVVGQGHVGSFTFGRGNDWWVSENTDRATRYKLGTGQRERRHAPSGDWIAQAYRYGLRPFYRICPKPGEFYKVVTHLSSAGDTSSNKDVDLNKTLEASDPWLPLWSGLAFMLAMLALGCCVFQFKDY